MDRSAHILARASLSFVWIFTGVTSAFWAQDIGYQVLAQAGITGQTATLSIYSGSLLDVVIGVWIITGLRRKLCYLLQILVMLLYTFLLTIIDPSFWLHPFGH